MTPTPPPANEVPPAGTIAGQATLIVTCYGERDQLQPLIDQMQQAFALVATGQNGYSIYCDESPPERLTWMHTPPLAGVPAHDTALVQLVLNAPGPAVTTWPAMRQQVRQSGLFAVMDRLAPAHVWGYTLVYQAVLAADTTPAAAFQVLHHVARGEETSEVQIAPLAQTEVPGGCLWLLDIPQAGEGHAAASVYAALVDAAHNDELIGTILCGSGAALLMPDLIAHKAYYHIRQYHRPDWVNPYMAQVRALQRSAQAVLQRQTRHPDPHDTNFRHLKQTFASILDATSLLETVQIVLEEQQANYEHWLPAIDLGAVTAYHRQHIVHATAYLRLLVEAGRSSMDVARTTVEMVQTELEKIENRREQATNIWLAVAGVVLAVPQLITTDVATEVILKGMLSPLLRTLGGTPPDSYSLLAALLAQIGCILLTLLPVVAAVRWWMRHARRG